MKAECIIKFLQRIGIAEQTVIFLKDLLLILSNVRHCYLAIVVIVSDLGHENTVILYGVLSCKWHIFRAQRTSNKRQVCDY